MIVAKLYQILFNLSEKILKEKLKTDITQWGQTTSNERSSLGLFCQMSLKGK